MTNELRKFFRPTVFFFLAILMSSSLFAEGNLIGTGLYQTSNMKQKNSQNLDPFLTIPTRLTLSTCKRTESKIPSPPPSQNSSLENCISSHWWVNTFQSSKSSNLQRSLNKMDLLFTPTDKIAEFIRSQPFYSLPFIRNQPFYNLKYLTSWMSGLEQVLPTRNIIFEHDLFRKIDNIKNAVLNHTIRIFKDLKKSFGNSRQEISLFFFREILGPAGLCILISVLIKYLIEGFFLLVKKRFFKENDLLPRPARKSIKAVSGENIVDTQLDLVRAYLRSGNINLASKMLKEAKAHANYEQLRLAKYLEKLL